jgi:hypothetical protein
LTGERKACWAAVLVCRLSSVDGGKERNVDEGEEKRGKEK